MGLILTAVVTCLLSVSLTLFGVAVFIHVWETG